MKKTLNHIQMFLFFFTQFSILPNSNSTTKSIESNPPQSSPFKFFNGKRLATNSDHDIRMLLAVRYNTILQEAKSKNIPLPPKALRNALQFYYQNLDFCRSDQWGTCDVNKKSIRNHRFIYIANFGVNSTQKRGIKIDLMTGDVSATVVAAGSGTVGKRDDPSHYNFANYREGLHTTAPGFMLTGAKADKKRKKIRRNGQIIIIKSKNDPDKLDLLGLENRNESLYGKYTHGAKYCNGNRCGRSWGCPALPRNVTKALYRDLEGGALWYNYAPSQEKKSDKIPYSVFDPTKVNENTLYGENSFNSNPNSSNREDKDHSSNFQLNQEYFDDVLPIYSGGSL